MKRFVILWILLLLLLSSCAKEPLRIPGDGAFHESAGEHGIVQRYFTVESDGVSLNAVYTYTADGKHHPTVLLIAGSGPSDCDSTLGAWKPLEDLALGLAAEGIHSLRLDKRTLYGADAMPETGGIAEEYLTDCLAALECLTEAGIEEIYLLGHSLGGQIAAELASTMPGIKGVILWNSTPRHLADVACDQYTRADPAHAALYRIYADAAKAATEETAQGYYYYGATDHYWATYNRLDTVSSIQSAEIPTLIVNSTADMQIFTADLEAWQSLTGLSHVTIALCDDVNHFGYCADPNDPAVTEQKYPFSQWLIHRFADFCKESL